MGILENWSETDLPLHSLFWHPSPITINPWVSLRVEGGQRTKGSCYKTYAAPLFLVPTACMRVGSSEHKQNLWLISIPAQCRGPWGFLYLPKERWPWHATSSIQSSGPRTSPQLFDYVKMSTHFNSNAPFKMAQDTTLIQHFHKRFGLWHLCKVKRLLFMNLCADCGYSISRYTLSVPPNLCATFFIPNYVFMQHILKPGTGYHWNNCPESSGCLFSLLEAE